jgi:uncharacterized membrane protein YfcA
LEWYLYLAVILAGFIAGFINTLAGSGSLVTLPLLIFLGLPATVANGTNRVAILLQNIVASTRFKREKVLDIKGALILGIPAVVGSIIGAQIAVNINEQVMRRVIGLVMVAMLFVIIVRPERWLVGRVEEIPGQLNLKLILPLFLIGVYGGFIQAGVGIFLLATLVLAVGYDLVRGNAVKVFIILLFTVFALAVFLINGQVNWIIGLILGLGNMLGAYVATKLAIDKGTIWIRRILIVVVAVSAGALLLF